jgi:branched-chain amino acid transport system substrate-binding protein
MTLNRRQTLQMIAAGSLSSLLPSLAFAQDGNEFRVGALCSVTGSAAPYGTGMQKMIIAVADEINAAGGAGGRMIKVFADDTQTQPQAAVLAAKKLLEVNRVEAMLGLWSSGDALAVVPLTNDANVVLMNTCGAPALSVPPANAKHLSYRFHPTSDRFGRGFAEACTKEGFKRPATMAFNNASGVSTVEGFINAWTAKGGEVVASVVYEPNQPSYRSELQSVLAAQPDVIVMGSYLADTTIILREWFQTGETNKWIMPAWAGNPDLVKALGAEATEGILTLEAVSNETATSYAAYDALYQKTLGQPGNSNVYGAMTYDMMVVLALAIEAAGPGADMAAINTRIRDVGNPDGEIVYSFIEGRDALKAGKSINYEGASSALDFDEFGDVRSNFGVSTISGGEISRRYVAKI